MCGCETQGNLWKLVAVQSSSPTTNALFKLSLWFFFVCVGYVESMRGKYGRHEVQVIFLKSLNSGQIDMFESKLTE